MKKMWFMSIALMAMSALSVQAEKLTIGVIEVPPFIEMQGDGHGWSPQIVTESLKGLGYEIEYKVYPYIRLVDMLDRGEIFGGLCTIPPGRGANILTLNLYNFRITFFYKKSAFPNGVEYGALADLARYRMGILAGAPQADDLRKAGIDLDFSNDENTDFKKLKLGRVDLVSIPEVMGFAALKAIGENANDYAMTKPMATLPASISISKDFPNAEKVMKDLCEGYERGVKSGAMVKILEKNFYGSGRVPSWVLRF
jgi:polar amino acid transport system substrate-binding protein